MPDIRCLPKQLEFLQATDPECMYSGAVRAGKTYSLALKTAMRAAKPYAREILCRKTLAALKGTTLRTLLEGDGKTPPILPAGSYVHHKADKIIRIKNGGEIIYFGLVNDGDAGTQQRIGSYSATGVNGDEATEYDEQDYRMLLSRPSLSVPGLAKQVNLACNPGSPSHFLAKRFAPPGSGYSRPLIGCRCISTETSDNIYLDADYLAMLARDAGSLWYRRFVKGLWVGAEGLVYDKWDRTVHVRTRYRTDRLVLGIDDGYTNPFAVVACWVDADGRAWIEREVYQSNLLSCDKIAAVKRICGDHRPEAIVIDPSAADTQAELAQAGLSVTDADNDVILGIQRVQDRLKVQGDGLPRLMVAPECESLIREFETYQWKPDRPKDEPVKKWDHALDALRYACSYLHATDGDFGGTVGRMAYKEPLPELDQFYQSIEKAKGREMDAFLRGR